MPAIEIDGGRLHYRVEGEGRPSLVFVHGFACSLEDWDAQVRAFSGRHRVAACDLRGHGGSTGFTSGFDIETYGEDVARLIDAEDLAPAVVVGHSLGCRVALEVATERPETVAGVVLIDGSRGADGDREAAEFSARDLMESHGYPAFARGLFEAMFVPSSDPGLRERIVARAVALPEAVAASLWPSLQGWDAAVMDSALSGLEVPALVIQSTWRDPEGGRRPLAPDEATPWTRLVERTAPEVEVAIVPGVGHFTMIEAADEVNRRLEAFLARVAGR